MFVFTDKIRAVKYKDSSYQIEQTSYQILNKQLDKKSNMSFL
jgi:hypothetical protein